MAVLRSFAMTFPLLLSFTMVTSRHLIHGERRLVRHRRAEESPILTAFHLSFLPSFLSYYILFYFPSFLFSSFLPSFLPSFFSTSLIPFFLHIFDKERNAFHFCVRSFFIIVASICAFVTSGLRLALTAPPFPRFIACWLRLALFGRQ